MEDIVDNLISTSFDNLDNLNFNLYEKIGLIIDYNNCKYEFILHLIDFDNNMVILGSSFLHPRTKAKFKNRPYFERQSWFKEIKHNVLYYNDPTLYDYEELNGGWGIGTSENWHLENISQIIKKLANHLYDYNELKIPKYGNLFFYGNSMGGFMSIVLSILIENSTSIADCPQFNLFSWWYWDFLKGVCFKGLSDSEILQYSHRLNIIELIHLRKIIPNSYIIMDCSDERDWNTQNQLFLNKFDSLPYQYNSQGNKINIHFVGKCIGHFRFSKYETINFIDNVITLRNNQFLYNPKYLEMLSSFRNYICHLYSLYNSKNISFREFINIINIYFNKWKSCRVDIKNLGNKDNTITFLEFSQECSFDFPDWFSDDNGKGCVISSNKNLEFKIRCVNDGQLSIIFRGHDYRHISQNERIPVYICYKKLFINNKLAKSKDSFVWHNQEQYFKLSCRHDEIIDIKIEFETIIDYFPKLQYLLASLDGNENDLKKNFDLLMDYINKLFNLNFTKIKLVDNF